MFNLCTMLSGISRLLIPRISRGAAANLKYSHNYEGTTNAKDIESVKQVEDELFGRYYGATDSSDLSRRFKSDFRKNKRRTSTTTSSSKLNKVDTPNTWGVTKLTLHDPMFRWIGTCFMALPPSAYPQNIFLPANSSWTLVSEWRSSRRWL